MSEFVYRVVNAETEDPIQKRSTDGRQHFYTKEHVARGVATRMTSSEYEPNPVHGFKLGIQHGRYKAQRAVVVWEDIEESE